MANYATWNPLAYKQATHTGAYYDEGNTKFVVTQVDTYGQFAVTTMPMPMYGKWYAELMITTSGSDWPQFGFIPESDVTQMLITDNIQGGTFANFSVVRPNDGAIFAYGTTSSSSYGSGYSTGDIVMLAFDGTTGKAWWGKNGTWFGDPVAGTGNGDTFSEPVFVTAGSYLNAGTITLNTETFRYDPPSGFVALSTENLAEPSISNLAAEKPEDHFNVVTYTGSGTNQSITSVGFESDMIWVKQRNAADNHVLVDSVRGYSKELYPNLTNAESGNTGSITATSTGFDLGSGGDLGRFNENTSTYVAWCWKADGAAVENNDGSITSQVSANTDAGFSIVSYTGTGSNSTVGHGLSQSPEMIIFKERNGATNWPVYHSGLSSAAYAVELNQALAEFSYPAYFQSTDPTDSVFYIGTDSYINNSSDNYIAYCWHSVEGYSKFGKYIGNGSADGSFVYTGFRPKFILFKKTSGGGDRWFMADTARSPFNVTLNDGDGGIKLVDASASDAEFANSPAEDFDIVSNGFKFRINDGGSNGVGATYIYMAFAESPFKYSLAR